MSGAATGSSSGLVVGLTGADRAHRGRAVAPAARRPRSRPDPHRGPPAPALPSWCAGYRLTASSIPSPTCANRRARRALEGVDLLFHLAAQVWQGRRPGASRRCTGANVEGTRNVVLARPAASVFASSAAVYGAWPDNPLPMDEDHEPRPTSSAPTPLQKLVAERTCLAEVPRHVIVRLAAVLGAHADARVAKAVRGYRLAVPAVTGTAQAVQWLDEDDAAEGLLAAGQGVGQRRRAWRRGGQHGPVGLAGGA